MRINKKNKRVTTVPLIGILVVGFVLILFTLINNNKSVPSSNEEDTEQVTEIIQSLEQSITTQEHTHILIQHLLLSLMENRFQIATIF